MNSKFEIGGYELEINTSGVMSSPDGASGAGGSGVGLQLTCNHGDVPGTTSNRRSLMQVFVKPSHARAIASALLSAATEARATL